MKKYYKNGQSVSKPKSITYKGYTYISPSDSILIKAGYEIKDEELPEYKLTNQDIENQRRMAYRHRADDLFIAYQAYSDLGDLEKAEKMKQMWLEERKKINEEYPYIEE